MYKNSLRKRKYASETRSPYLLFNKKHSEPESPPWSKLPPTVVVVIFQCLTDVDRINMCKVCKTWHQCYRDPSLWRKRVFQFVETRKKPASETNQLIRNSPSFFVAGGKKAIKFATYFSSYLQDVEVYLNTATRENASDWSAFSKMLDETKLKSLNVRFFSDRIRGRNQNVDLLEPLVRIILKQPSLEAFYIGLVQLEPNNGLNVLKCLADTCGDKLKTLDIYGLFNEIAPLNYKDQVITEIKKFTHLRYLNINSVFLKEELFTFWTRQCPSLSSLRIFITPQGYAPPSWVWQALVATHPNLEVEINTFDRNEVELNIAILSKAIPLIHLIWETGACYSKKDKLTNFLERLANYQNSLQSLFVGFMANSGDPDHAAVMNVLSKFSKLAPHKFERDAPNSKNWIIALEDEAELAEEDDADLYEEDEADFEI